MPWWKSSSRATKLDDLIAQLENEDSDSRVRVSAAAQLAQLGDVRAIEPLLQVAAGGNPGWRQFWQEAANAAREALRVMALQPEAHLPLYKGLAHSRSQVRLISREILDSSLPDWQSGPAASQAMVTFVHLLRDTDPSIRQGALEALNHIAPVLHGQRDADSLSHIVAALQDTQSEVRNLAARILGVIGDSKALESLILALADKSVPVQTEARAALSAIEPEWRLSNTAKAQVPALARQLASTHGTVARGAYEALEAIDPDWRSLAAVASEVMPDLVATLREPLPSGNQVPEKQQAAARALGVVRHPEALEPLIEALDKSQLIEEAARSLGQLGDRRACAALASRLIECHGLSHLWWPLAEALAALGDPRAVYPLILSFLDTMKRSPEEERHLKGLLDDIDPRWRAKLSEVSQSIAELSLAEYMAVVRSGRWEQ